MAVDATAGTVAVVITEVVAAVTVNRPGTQTAQEAPFFVGETKSVIR
jgi:F0F1-type ATP synthase assembly protein I